MQFWIDTINQLHRHPNHSPGSTSDIIDTYFGDEQDSTSEVSDSDTMISMTSNHGECIWSIDYTLRADVQIPITRFTSRMCLELQRMGELPHGSIKAFPLTLILRMDVLGTTRMIAFAQSVPVDEIEIFLLIQIRQERDYPYPEHPLNCAQVFFCLENYVTAKSNSKTSHVWDSRMH